MIGITSALRGLGVGLMIGGASTIAASLYAYGKGNETDKARSDAVIARMVREADAATIKAERAYRELEQSNNSRLLRAAEQGAQAKAHLDRQVALLSSVRADRDAVATDRDGLRARLSDVARGPTDPANDSLAACRDRAEGYGEVLGRALRADQECRIEAENLAIGIRTLQTAWPVN